MPFRKGDFDYDNVEGKLGENFCLSYLESKYPKTSIFDVSDVRLFQLMDIDFVLGKTPQAADFVRNFLNGGAQLSEDLDTILKSDEIMTIEVKTDTRTCGLHPTGNVVFEVVSKRSPGTYATRAHYVFYICSKETAETSGVFDVSNVYIINMWKLRGWHYKNHASCRKTFAYDYNIDFRLPINKLVSDGVAKELPEYIWFGWQYSTKEIIENNEKNTI
jgi:hypothetical protein